MAHFYGILQGGRKPVTRTGHKNTGLETTAASWQGSVCTYLYEKDGTDYARVFMEPWRGRGVNKVLYDGPVGSYNPNGAKP